ncbi:MAG: hypothetical protein AABX52_00025 [Nanoarchaeota archaeon]
MKYRLLLLIFLIVLVACQPKVVCVNPNVIINNSCCHDWDSNGVCDKQQDVVKDKESPAAQQSQIKTPPAPILEQPKLVVSNATQKWKDRLKNKVKSYQFVGQVVGGYHATFFVMGDRVRIDLDNAIVVNVAEGTDNRINRIYLNKEEGTALGVCSAGFTLCKSRKGEAYAIEYEKYKPLLPPELFKDVNGLLLELEQPNAELLQDRKMTLLRYVDGSVRHSLYIDEFFGMPIRYVKEKSNQKSVVEFKNMAFNTVRDEDFRLPVLA